MVSFRCHHRGKKIMRFCTRCCTGKTTEGYVAGLASTVARRHTLRRVRTRTSRTETFYVAKILYSLPFLQPTLLRLETPIGRQLATRASTALSLLRLGDAACTLYASSLWGRYVTRGRRLSNTCPLSTYVEVPVRVSWEFSFKCYKIWTEGNSPRSNVTPSLCVSCYALAALCFYLVILSYLNW